MEKAAPKQRAAGETVLWWDLMVAMVRTGIFTYGGGPSVIPLMRHEAVRRYGWMQDDEFGEIVALANALPGPIATKLAAYLGYRLKGSVGAAVAVVVHILPTSAAMVVLLGSLYALKHSAVVAGMIAAVKPVIVVMLAVMAYEFGAAAGRGLGWRMAVAAGLLAFLLLGPAGVHPALVVLAALLYGSVHLRVVDRIRSRRRGLVAGSEAEAGPGRTPAAPKEESGERANRPGRTAPLSEQPEGGKEPGNSGEGPSPDGGKEGPPQ